MGIMIANNPHALLLELKKEGIQTFSDKVDFHVITADIFGFVKRYFRYMRLY